jgi:hypothetical protein
MSFPADSFSPRLASLVPSRREFLRLAGACAAAPFAVPSLPLHALTPPTAGKVVVITFGGGARDEETFAPGGHENIPGMLKTLLPQSTFFGQVINRGILGHYVATTSLATGVYETFNNFSGVPSPNPTVFEYFRKGLKRPPQDAWLISPSNGFRNMGCGTNQAFGSRYGASVILPKQLVQAADPHSATGNLDRLLRDTYEEPHLAAGPLQAEAQLQQMEESLGLSGSEFQRLALTMQSADELSASVAMRLMQRSAPSLLWITLHDIDMAHSGAYSLYIDGIQRTDGLCVEMWKHIQSNPEYVGKTTLFILPDFGRDSDTNPAGNGFQHHRTGDAASRTTWMMVLGPRVRQGVFIERPVDSRDLVPTVGRLLGFPTPFAEGAVLSEVV